MNDCKNIHEAYWEAICVENTLKWSLQRQITKGHVVKPIADDIQTDFEMPQPKHEQKDKKGPEFPSMSNDVQKVQAGRKDKQVVEVPHIDFVLGESSMED